MKKIILLCVISILSFSSLGYAQTVYDKWSRWTAQYGHGTALGLLNKRFPQSSTAQLKDTNIANALHNPTNYVVSYTTRQQLGAYKYNLEGFNNDDDKIDKAFSQGSSIDSRTKWNNYIYQNMFNLAMNANEGELIIMSVGAKHCIDFDIRNISMKHLEPKLTPIVFVGQNFKNNEMIGHKEYSTLLRNNGYHSQAETYAPKVAEISFFADEVAYAAFLNRYYGDKPYKPSFDQLNQNNIPGSPKIIIFCEIHASTKGQVWNNFLSANDLMSLGIKSVYYFGEGLARLEMNTLYTPDALSAGAYLDENKTKVKFQEILDVMNLLNSYSEAGIETAVASIGHR